MDTNNDREYYGVETDSENQSQVTAEVKKSIKPEIDIAACNGCGGCVELGPEIFRVNETFGFVEVVELDYYDPEIVLEAVKNCPKRAIEVSEESLRDSEE